MVQKEVALRICAGSGDPNYGRLSVMLQYHCESQYLFEVGPESFKPPPKVDSAIIRLLPRAQPKQDIGDYDLFSGIVRTAFSQRRKTISNSLKSMLGRETFITCDIDPGLRAENLAIEDQAGTRRVIGHGDRFAYHRSITLDAADRRSLRAICADTKLDFCGIHVTTSNAGISNLI